MIRTYEYRCSVCEMVNTEMRESAHRNYRGKCVKGCRSGYDRNQWVTLRIPSRLNVVWKTTDGTR